MRAYGYVRISRDEDGKKESIGTQKRLVCDYAESHNINLINVFEDNNISGYTFEREGMQQLKELVDDKKVDILIAKDLSRIGRHNAKTLLFLNYLDDHGVRLVLLNDNYDSKRDDDTTIGIKTWYNEMYLKDLSKKIKSNIRQKQKEGLVIVPHFGYMKDPSNPKKVVIDHEVTATIKLIFQLYINKGFVARRSNHKNGDVRITYVCATFHRYGSKYCGSHRLFEDEIDSLVVTELRRRLVKSQERIKNLDKNVEERLNRKKDFDKLIHNVTIEIEKKKQEIKNYSRQLARNMIDEDIFDEMVTEANQQLDKQIKYLQELERQKDNCENEKEYLVNSIEVIEDILKNNKLTNADIVNLVDDITLWETEETGKYGKKKLRVEIGWRI